MLLGYLQALFDIRHPNSQLLFSKPRNKPLFGLLTSPLGLQTTSNKKVALNQKLMCHGHLQVLLNALPLNSQLLFSEPGKSHLFEDFYGTGCKTKFRSQHLFLPCSPISKKVWHVPLTQNPGRRYIWQKTHFLGSRLTLWGLGSKWPPQKLLARS